MMTQIWSESSLSAWKIHGPLATHWVHSEDWSDCADSQADLSLRWAHRPFCWFCPAPAHLVAYSFSLMSTCDSKLSAFSMDGHIIVSLMNFIYFKVWLINRGKIEYHVCPGGHQRNELVTNMARSSAVVRWFYYVMFGVPAMFKPKCRLISVRMW